MPPKRKTTKSDADAGSKGTKKQRSSKLAIGDSVDSVDVTLMKEDESTVTLTELTKDKGVVIFLYPRANTPGCTKQACGFRDNYEEFAKAGFDVYGMSYDKPKSQLNWKNKYNLPFSLLFDEQGIAIKAFGASKAPKGIIRSHIVIQKGGKVLDVQNKISPNDSFTFALETVQNAK